MLKQSQDAFPLLISLEESPLKSCLKHYALICTDLYREFRDCESRSEQLLERNVQGQLLEDPISQFGTDHRVQSGS